MSSFTTSHLVFGLLPGQHDAGHIQLRLHGLDLSLEAGRLPSLAPFPPQAQKLSATQLVS